MSAASLVGGTECAAGLISFRYSPIASARRETELPTVHDDVTKLHCDGILVEVHQMLAAELRQSLRTLREPDFATQASSHTLRHASET